VLQMGAAGVGPRCHARERQYAHQPLDPLAVDPMSHAAQVYRHLAATVKRVPCVFGINLHQQCQFLLIRCGGQARRINGGAGNTRKLALPGQCQRIIGADPVLAVFYRLIPDFFLSQSSSIFKRPISE
jgi:hypothetical protein